MQVKPHRWAAADPGRRFDDLFNLMHDPATLLAAFHRGARNLGARTAGVDGLTVADIEQLTGAAGFLDDLRAQLKAGTFRPQPVRERMIPKPGSSGKLRRLGIPAVADRVVQAALKLVLDSILEADFEPVSYGLRPRRRARRHRRDPPLRHPAAGGCCMRTSRVLDSIDHTALMDRVRRRVKDKRVLGLVRAFLKAGILTELGETGTPTPARHKAVCCHPCWPTCPAGAR